MIKQEILQQIGKDNIMTLDLAKVLDVTQTSVFASIKRRSKKFIHDTRVIKFLKEKGFSDEEIFEPESISN